MVKNGLLFLALLVTFGLGVWLTSKYFSWQTVRAEETSEVLLEKIRSVYKLVLVEGHFSEVYDYQDYWGYNFSPFRKKALLRVKAKVSVGYDMENFVLEARPEEQKIVMTRLPEPEILSVDHDLDYYDISEGTFNSFNREDYNRMNANAKEMIMREAQRSDLLNSARQQGRQTLEMLELMVKNAGWTLEYERSWLEPSQLDPVLSN